MNKNSILIVEDDRPIRNLIITALKTHDYKYLEAENGTSAILEASSHNPDIVLLDLAGYRGSGSDQKNQNVVKYADYCYKCKKRRHG